jgi:hypothetical protein
MNKGPKISTPTPPPPVVEDNAAKSLIEDEEKRRQKRRNSYANTVLTSPEGTAGKTTLG